MLILQKCTVVKSQGIDQQEKIHSPYVQSIMPSTLYFTCKIQS